VFGIFPLEVEPPDGMVVSGISTDSGQVEADNAIEWYGPRRRCISAISTSTPTPTPPSTFTPTATVIPTWTPVSYDIWLPMIRR